MAMLTPGRARSSRLRTALESTGATTAIRLVAKYSGVFPSRLAFLTAAICSQSAEAKTSARAPCSSWVRRAWLPAKLNVTATLGLSASKASATARNGSASDAAANTVNVSAGVASCDATAAHPPAATARTNADAASASARNLEFIKSRVLVGHT